MSSNVPKCLLRWINLQRDESDNSPITSFNDRRIFSILFQIICEIEPLEIEGEIPQTICNYLKEHTNSVASIIVSVEGSMNRWIHQQNNIKLIILVLRHIFNDAKVQDKHRKFINNHLEPDEQQIIEEIVKIEWVASFQFGSTPYPKISGYEPLKRVIHKERKVSDRCNRSSTISVSDNERHISKALNTEDSNNCNCVLSTKTASPYSSSDSLAATFEEKIQLDALTHKQILNCYETRIKMLEDFNAKINNDAANLRQENIRLMIEVFRLNAAKEKTDHDYRSKLNEMLEANKLVEERYNSAFKENKRLKIMNEILVSKIQKDERAHHQDSKNGLYEESNETTSKKWLDESQISNHSDTSFNSTITSNDSLITSTDVAPNLNVLPLEKNNESQKLERMGDIDFSEIHNPQNTKMECVVKSCQKASRRTSEYLLHETGDVSFNQEYRPDKCDKLMDISLSKNSMIPLTFSNHKSEHLPSIKVHSDTNSTDCINVQTYNKHMSTTDEFLPSLSFINITNDFKKWNKDGLFREKSKSFRGIRNRLLKRRSYMKIKKQRLLTEKKQKKLLKNAGFFISKRC